VSSVTSAGFFNPKKCLDTPGPLLEDQEDGGPEGEGSGGLRDGNVTGIGLAGGCLFFFVSCCPASRLPVCEGADVSVVMARAG
jgi:hypothetical protein